MILVKVIFMAIVSLLCRSQEIRNAFPSIEVYGSKFFYSDTGEQFFMKGIAYQPTPDSESLESKFTNIDEDEVKPTTKRYIDPLADPNICLRDIPYFQRLGVNTLRVYAIDPQLNHDICMNSLMDSGIYVILDLSEPAISINRDNPNWDITIWERYKAVIDSMNSYRNVLGFFAGNEVTNDKSNTDASAFVKAAVRDSKNYIEEKNYRRIPVGYSTNDDIETRSSLSKYFICGDVKADFYGINMYEWCGYSSFEISGYKERTQEFKNYPVPIFFSEFGCNLIRPRPFTEINALYGPQMANVWSGGIVYMYFEEENKYGVVELAKDKDTPRELEDFEILATSFNNVSPLAISKENYTEILKEKGEFNINCPSLSHLWKANERLPPTPNKEKCECIELTQPCVLLPLEDKTNYKKMFDFICGEVDCVDIKADGVLGYYGDFSECSVEQKLSVELSKYFLKQEEMDKCPYESKDILFQGAKKTSNQPKNKQGEDICSKYFKNLNINKEKKVDSNQKEDSNLTSQGIITISHTYCIFIMLFLVCLLTIF
ncbi:1,3-beta-glucanosyltransferase Gas2p [Monosporozyma unispora]